MGYKYAGKKRGDSAPPTQQKTPERTSATPSVPMDAMRSALGYGGAAGEQRRIDLASAMREKMQNAFGIDIGKVRMYESPRVEEAGAEALAQGDRIAFAPGKADFGTAEGQSLLGHELSHIAAQARGEVAGSGYLDNGALEARADREGAMAAAGQQVYADSAPLSPAPAGASAPVQAKKGKQSPEEPRTNDKRAIADVQRMLAIKNRVRAAEYEEKLSGEKKRNPVQDEDVEWYERMAAHPSEGLQQALLDARDKHIDTAYERLFGDVDTETPNKVKPGKGKHRVGDVGEFKSSKRNAGETFKHLFGGRSDKKKKSDREALRNDFLGSSDALSLETYDMILNDMTTAFQGNIAKSKKTAKDKLRYESDAQYHSDDEEARKLDLYAADVAGAENADAMQGISSYLKKLKKQSPYDDVRLAGHLSDEDDDSRAGVLYSLLRQTKNDSEDGMSAESVENRKKAREQGMVEFIAQSAQDYANGDGWEDTTKADAIGNAVNLRKAKKALRRQQRKIEDA